MNARLDAAEVIITNARRDGLDPIERLNAAGLLLTDRRMMQLRVESMEQIITMIDDIPAHQLLKQAGQPGNLAEDYRKVLLETLSELATQARTKWFR